jgi:hypothetical protein
MKPTALTGVVFLILLLLQFAFFSFSMTSHRSSEYPWATRIVDYGIGRPIETLHDDEGRQEFHIHWGILSLNFAICYVIAVVLVAGICHVTKLQNPIIIYGGVILGIVCLTFVVSILLSRYYWGYFFSRPGVLPEVNEIAHVHRIIPIMTVRNTAGEYEFAVRSYSLARELAYAEEYPYENLAQRILVYLHHKHLLPNTITQSLSPYTQLYQQLPQTGLLAKAKPGYTTSGELRGVLVVASTVTEARYVFLSVTGQQVENDHYPFYEMMFDVSAQSEQPVFVRGQRFFYDVAGLEGFEWYVVWFFLSLFGTIGAFPMITVILVIRKTLRAKASSPSAERGYSC